MSSLQHLCCIFLAALLSLQVAHSFSTNDTLYQATLNISSGASKSRGNKFALAFMNNHNLNTTQTANQISLFITTEQERSVFTVQTRFAGVAGEGFTETSIGSGLYSRSEVAWRGSFTFISLPAGVSGGPDIAVQTDGSTNTADRTKGVLIEAADPTHELTVYVFNEEQGSAEAFMAINCVQFPTARNYQYFVFSTEAQSMESQFLLTPCEDDTMISVRPSQRLSHPAWVMPNVSTTDPTGVAETDYTRVFHRFDTLMLSSTDDLTGSIVTSDKPLSVFVGHQCGAPVGSGTCDYLVEQVPPHPTYGYLFFMAPFSVRQSGELIRIGSIGNGAQVTINCNCEPEFAGGNRVSLRTTAPGVYTATVDRGQYAQCRTPQNAQTYCCIQSEQPVTVMGYTLGSSVDNLASLPNLPFNPIGDPSMVYISPASSYLNSYHVNTLSTQFQGFLSYILPTQIFDNSPEDQRRFTVNGETLIPAGGYTPIQCLINGVNEVCAYGATAYLGKGNFEIGYENIGDGAFWGYAYGYAESVSFGYPLSFEMEPVGLAWIVAEAQEFAVLEGLVRMDVDLGFRIPRGDRSVRTRAFIYAERGTATPGGDFEPIGTSPGAGQSNVRWEGSSVFPSEHFWVTIWSNPGPEPVEAVYVDVQCDGNENCYIPKAEYTILIVDHEGFCSELPLIANGVITYSYDFDTPLPRRPFGTVATYACMYGIELNDTAMRTCDNGVWMGAEPSCSSDAVCGEELPSIANGLISYSPNTAAPYSLGTMATYSCNSGYKLTGGMMRTCVVDDSDNSNGVFGGVAPTCESVDCGPLPNPTNGQVSTTNGATTVGSVAMFTCNTGYTLSHQDMVRCGEDGQWSPASPSCQIINCGLLPDPDSGLVDMSNGTTFGSIAMYTCQMAADSRTCGADGSWTSAEPNCQALFNAGNVIGGIVGGVIAVVWFVISIVIIVLLGVYISHLKKQLKLLSKQEEPVPLQQYEVEGQGDKAMDRTSKKDEDNM